MKIRTNSSPSSNHPSSNHNWRCNVLNKFYPPNSSDDLCLLFPLYPSMGGTYNVEKASVDGCRRQVEGEGRAG